MGLKSCLLCSVVLYLIIYASGKPSPPPQQGPCVGMDCLHGVLMHNDENRGDAHKTEDQYLRFKSELETEKPLSGPDDAEKVFHGALMHGDQEAGIHHDENGAAVLPEIKSNAKPEDQNKVMHESMHGDNDNVRKHSWDNKDEGGMKGPLSGEKMMHGVMMHGDANHGDHAEETAKEEPKGKIGPTDAEEQFHGVLMHGDNVQGKEHKHEENPKQDNGEGRETGPNSDQLHGILMHGDKEIGHDHSKDHTDNKEEVFRDISKILEMDVDKDLLKIIDIEKIIQKDKEDYAQWIIENPNFQDESMMGSTLADVSDSVYRDIDIMKKRYLAKTNQESEKTSDDDYNYFKDLPFSAEDARDNLDENTQAHEGEDARHNLELLGSTDPINARHRRT